MIIMSWSPLILYIFTVVVLALPVEGLPVLCVSAAGCEDTYLDNNCHPNVIQRWWSYCLAADSSDRFTAFVVFLLTSGCASACAPFRALCQEHSRLLLGGWRVGGGVRRDTHFFPLLLRGLPLYIRRSELLGSHTAPLCFRNSANKPQPGPLTRE